MSTPAPRAVASPCVSLCRMDADSGWCLGCLRTLDEIALWGSLDDAGVRVSHLELDSPSLDDVFADATGRRLEGADE